MAKQKIKNPAKAAAKSAAATVVVDGAADAGPKREARVDARAAKGGAPKQPGKLKVKLKAPRKKRARLVGTEAPPAPAMARAASHIHKIVRRHTRLGRMERLEIAIDEVRRGGRLSPRTRKLQTSGVAKMAQKLVEEAGEAAIEAVLGNRTALINESVDLIYNLLVLLAGADVPLEAVWAEMDRRELALGMAEKLPKAFDPDG